LTSLGRPRLLALSQSLPFPPHSGVTNRTFHILCELEKEFAVELIPFYRLGHQPTRLEREKAWQELSLRLSRVAEPVSIPGEISRPRKVLDHLRSRLARQPFTFYEYASQEFLQAIRDAMLREPPDLVHLDSLDLFRYLPALGTSPVICTHHSVESDLLRLRAKRVSMPMIRGYVNWQADRLEETERSITPGLALNVMMSEVDRQRLLAIAPQAVTTVVPNGVNTDFFHPDYAPGVAGRVVFVGPTYSFPNFDAVEFLAREIWPRVRALLPAATLDIVGRYHPEHMQRFRDIPGMKLSGHLDDLRPSLAAASCVVAPLRVGGGTRLKILDAWAMGKAVVSTSTGCEGLDARDGENLLVRDDPVAFADAILEVLSDQAMRIRLGDSGRQTVIARYAWGKIGDTIRAAYREVLKSSGAL
jgi:polysaccharide biosynthesis protein PslH